MSFSDLRIAALVLLVICGAALAVLIGQRVARWAIDYHRWAHRANRQHRAPVPAGACRTCRERPARQGSDYCSPEHETEADWRAAGY